MPCVQSTLYFFGPAPQPAIKDIKAQELPLYFQITQVQNIGDVGSDIRQKIMRLSPEHAHELYVSLQAYLHEAKILPLNA